MTRHTLKYNGKNLKDYGLYVSGEGAWDKPAPDITKVIVPGRNGELVTFNNRYENVTITYRCGIVKDFHENFTNLIAWLYSAPGYKKLVDSAHPDVYRMALIESGISPDVKDRLKHGEFEIAFNCKPQTFLESGDAQTTFTSSGTITNPTAFDAMPLIRVYGSGTLTVGGKTITVANNSSYIDIDCDIQDAYRGATNCNGNITLNSGEFPTLGPGSNSISKSSGISSVTITPRWWRL